jgi:hypothetical protein
MPHNFILSSEVLASGRTVHYAQLTGSTQPKFIIGSRTVYLGNVGLINTAVTSGLVYNPAEFISDYGFWAYFIYPTAMAESKGSYTCLNTYDKAQFTYSFMQYGAHVPNGDFVKFFRKLLALPNAADYFPKLVLKDSRIFYKDSTGTLKQLESDASTQALMDYLNPTRSDVETQELICSARMIHWAGNDTAHRKIQVETGIQHFKNNMVEYNRLFKLNGVPAKVCQVICDIRHQGRGKNHEIANALNTNGNYDLAFANLCTVGAAKYITRITTVRNTINSLLASGRFNKKYDSATNSFVDM